MQIPFEQILRAIGYEAFKRRWVLLIAFVVINVTAATFAVSWPPRYQSWTTVFVEQKNIIQPLMQGAAVAGDVRDQAKIAREIVFSRKVMTQVLQKVGLIHEGQTDVEQAKAMERAKDRTAIMNVGTNLIRIEYTDRDPERAFQATKLFADAFITESLDVQAEESQAAFEFIDRQVKEYHEKLTNAEQALKEFRSRSIDARPGTAAEVSKRVDELHAFIEKTTLELKEMRIKEASLEKQLSGEAEVTIALTRESQYRARISDLQSQLDNLRLTYHDTYPDIVRIKHQINDLKEALERSQRSREEARRQAEASNQVYVDDSIRVNPIYQQLKQQLFDTRTTIQTLNARLSEAKLRLQEEVERAERIHSGEAMLAELTRDYEVNRDIYQDLLRRRENARVSRNLGQDQQELTLRIHEPAFVPLQPSGVRMLYMVLAGGVLSIALPLGLLCAFVQFDPRIRLESIISKRMKLPVLAVVPHFWAPAEQRALRRQVQWSAVVGVIAVGALVVLGALRATEVL